MTRRGGGGGRGGWGGAFGGAEPDLTRRPGSERRTLRRIAGFFTPYRGRLWFIAGLILVTVTIGVVNPILLKLIIDNLTGPKDLNLLYLQAGLMIVLPIITSAIGVWQAYLSNVVGQRVMNDLRLALYRHLQWMPLRFFTETRTGEIQSRISNDVGGVQSVVTDTASSLLANFATVATTVVAMLILDWRLTLLSLGLLPVFAYITFRVGKVRREVSTLTQRSMAEMSAITEESLSVCGILLSKTFGQQEASIERFAAESQRLGDLQVRGQMIGRWFFALIGTFFSIMPAFVYLLAGSLIIGGDTHVSIGTIVAFTTLQSRLFFPLGQLLNVQVEIQGALALFDRIFEYLEMEHDIVDAPDAVALEPATMRGEVRLEDVSFRYPVAPAQVEVAPEAAAAEAEGRAVPTTIQPFALDDISFDRGAGAAGGPGRAVGKWQDHHHLPDPAPVRRGHGHHQDRRRRRAAADPRLAGSRDRGGDPGDLPVPRHGARQPAVRKAGGDPGGDRDGGAGRRHPRPDHGAARTATTPWWGSAATSSPVARSSASRSPASCSRTHAC